MIKFMLLAKRKAGLSREEFIDYYENNHVPLALRLFPEVKKSESRRNFFHHDQVIHPQGFSGEVEFDVVTETIWPDQEALDGFLVSTQDPAKLAQLVADEENLFDRDTMRYLTVEVRETDATKY